MLISSASFDGRAPWYKNYAVPLPWAQAHLQPVYICGIMANKLGGDFMSMITRCIPT